MKKRIYRIDKFQFVGLIFPAFLLTVSPPDSERRKAFNTSTPRNAEWPHFGALFISYYLL